MKLNDFTLRFLATVFCVVFLVGCNEKQDSTTGNYPPDSSQDKWGQFALVVIGTQNYFWNDSLAEQFPDFPKNISELLKFCRAEGIDIIHLRARFDPDMSNWPSCYKLAGKIPCVKGTEEEKAEPFARELPGETVIYKHSFDGFLDTGLADYLDKHNKKHLLVAGLDSGVCVLSTCFTAFQKGYLLTLLEDCCAGEINGYKFVTQYYNGFLFETIRFENIDDNYASWMERLDRLESVSKR